MPRRRLVHVWREKDSARLCYILCHEHWCPEPIIMTRSITELGPREVEFLARLSSSGRMLFTMRDAAEFWGARKYAREKLTLLESKGWVDRLEQGSYMVVPLQAGSRGSGARMRLRLAPSWLPTAPLPIGRPSATGIGRRNCRAL